MRALIARRAVRPRRADYAPSRLAYRLQRVWLTPLFRGALRIGVPVAAAVCAGAIWIAHDDNAETLAHAIHDLRRAYEEMPVFMVSLLEIEGADPDLAAEMRRFLPVRLPVSSYDLDLPEIREAIAALPAVAGADVAVIAGTLRASVDQRVPVALWRTRAGLSLIDKGGAVAGMAGIRSLHPDLPLVAGRGADAAVPEALAILDAAGPLRPRLRGLVRVGGRRWDAVLKDGRRILLPERGPRAAMERAVMLAGATGLLDRAVRHVDLRLPGDAVVRLTEGGAAELAEMRLAARAIRASAQGN